MKDRYDFSQAVVGKYLGKIPRNFQIVAETDEGQIAKWHNPSVRLMAGDRDPVEAIVEKARSIVLAAMDSKTFTFPVDPFKLAEMLSVKVIPKADVRDARTVPGPGHKPQIEYNPTRPPARVRFSICHELGHALFPDCLQQIRHRLFHTETSPVEYELEMLCNLAAAEFLMPIGSIQEDISKLRLSIDTALELRVKYQASVEAILLRLAGLSGINCAVFAAVTDERSISGARRHRLEYVKGAQNWDAGVRRGDLLPFESVANECTAIGFTAKKIEEWVPGHGKLKVEMVAVSPYLNRVMPRIVGLIRPAGAAVTDESPIHIVRGDALLPRGEGEKILAHVVNDQTPNWGAGFGRALQAKWPLAHRQFKEFFEQTRGPKLGRTYLSRVTEDMLTFQMICQRGYGPSNRPRLRYGVLQQCLVELREAATQHNATVHMPKIGSGEAGGSWSMVSNLIAEELCARGVSVTVYELPGARISSNRQGDLFHESHR
jgi:Zn-dependent peptidase ImmA (M78 family)